jgi:hypothetical protein
VYVLAATLLLTAGFVAADFVYRTTGVVAPPYPRWKMDEDRSYAELAAFAAFVVAAALLVRLGVTTRRSSVLAVWGGVVLLVALDDLLQLHETGGANLARRLGLRERLGLDPQGWGELAVWGLMGVVCLVALGLGHRSSGPTARRISVYLLGGVGLLAVCAVGIDMLAIVAEPAVDGVEGYAIAMAESAGESVAAGYFLAVAVRFTATSRRPSGTS